MWHRVQEKLREKATKNDNFDQFLPLIARHCGPLLGHLWINLADFLSDFLNVCDEVWEPFIVCSQEWRKLRGHSPLYSPTSSRSLSIPSKFPLLFYPSKGGWVCWGLSPSTSNFIIGKTDFLSLAHCPLVRWSRPETFWPPSKEKKQDRIAETYRVVWKKGHPWCNLKIPIISKSLDKNKFARLGQKTLSLSKKIFFAQNAKNYI